MLKTNINGTTYKYHSDINKITFKEFISKFSKIIDLHIEKLMSGFFDNVELTSIVLGCDYATAMDCPAHVTSKIISIWKGFDFGNLAVPKWVDVPKDLQAVIGKLKGKIKTFKLNIEDDLYKYNPTNGQLQVFQDCMKKSSDNLPNIDTLIEKVQAQGEEAEYNDMIEVNKYFLRLQGEYAKHSHVFSATILQSVFYGSFKSKRNNELASKLEQLPFNQILPIGFFFAVHSTNLLSSRANC